MITWQWFAKDPNVPELNKLVQMWGWYTNQEGERDADGGAEWWDGPMYECIIREDWRTFENLGYQCVMRYWPA